MADPTKTDLRPKPSPDGSPWRVEGAPEGQAERSGGPRSWRPPGGRRFWGILLVLLALNLYLSSLGQPSRTPVSYTFFREQVEAGNVEEVTSQGETIKGTFRTPVLSSADVPGPGAGGAGAPAGGPRPAPDAAESAANRSSPPGAPPGRPRPSASDDREPIERFETVRPAFADDELLRMLIAKGTEVNARAPDERSLLETLVVGFGPTLLLVGLFVLLMRRAAAAGGVGPIAGLGRSRAKRYEASTERTTFADVAGIDEAESELVEIVDFLRNPDRYRRLGGAIPRGVLLSGPPGTGKTLLARAVAGEADVPFFSLSASEFVEMVVGVGASRVRDLFEQAKQTAPAIIFVDELDAIGRARGGGAAIGGHDEREQTLNQILTEMDGFSGSEGVIVLAATNRPEILDPALLRPGRFDRRVQVNPPDQAGRVRILEVHTRSVPLAADVDLGAVASSTAGMVGADLKNLVNEAALTAARRDHERVETSDFTDALEKIVLGAERHIMMSPEERERTAYHESGHALLGMLEPGADPVRKISIVPRGRALGVTFQSPETDRYGYDAGYLRGRIVGALGGRAAEEIVYGNVTTGAESDLEQITRIARQMVGRWGMSEAVGLVSVLPGPQDEPTLFPGQNGGPSEATQELVDSEVRRIVDACYQTALERLGENRGRLEALARALLERETLDEREAYDAAGFDARQPSATSKGERGDGRPADRPPSKAAELAPQPRDRG